MNMFRLASPIRSLSGGWWMGLVAPAATAADLTRDAAPAAGRPGPNDGNGGA